MSLQSRFALRRFHFVSGVLPFFLFGFVFIFPLFLFFRPNGASTYDQFNQFLVVIPFFRFFVLAFIVGPILFHFIYGLGFVFLGSTSLKIYPHFANRRYFWRKFSFLPAMLYFLTWFVLFLPVFFLDVENLSSWLLGWYEKESVCFIHLVGSFFFFGYFWAEILSGFIQGGGLVSPVIQKKWAWASLIF